MAGDHMEFAGFVKISRSILNSGIWKDGYDAALYFFFLLRASHNHYGKLKPGQFYSSIMGMAQALGWSRNSTAKHIVCLVSKGLISISHDYDGTIYTVIRWNELCQDQAIAQNVSIHAQDLCADAQDMNRGVQNMGMRAQDMNLSAQDLNDGCSRFEQNQEYINQKEPRAHTSRGQAFEFFWKLYPRHEDKTSARKAWMDMRVSAETLISALETAKRSKEWLEEGGRYIPRAAKWLDGKWEDYIDQDNREERTAWTEY